MRASQAVIVVLTALSVAATALAEEKKLYRYRNAEGVLVIDFKVPPEHVAKGYDVITPSGRLLLRVPPQSEKPANQSDAHTDNADDGDEADASDDQYLLRSYSSAQEVEAAGDRKLRQLQNNILVIEKNIETLHHLREEEQKRAANQQRSGRAVSAALLKQIETLRRQERDARQVLTERRREYTDVEKRYRAYAQRYRELSQSNPREDRHTR